MAKLAWLSGVLGWPLVARWRCLGDSRECRSDVSVLPCPQYPSVSKRRLCVTSSLDQPAKVLIQSQPPSTGYLTGPDHWSVTRDATATHSPAAAAHDQAQ